MSIPTESGASSPEKWVMFYGDGNDDQVGVDPDVDGLVGS
jgi:hypothetical protein